MTKVKEMTDTKVGDNGQLKQPTLQQELESIVKQHNEAMQKKEQYANLAQRCLGAIEVLERIIKNEEGKDSFSKECIDTLTAFLSEHRHQFICIIAGYKESLEKCFFKYNTGLERRFPYRYSINSYSAEQIRDIFIKIIKDKRWNLSNISNDDNNNDNSTTTTEDIITPVSFFEENKDFFPFNGGDMELLFHNCKLAHCQRVWKLSDSIKRKLTKEDIENGFQLFLKNEKNAKRKESKEKEEEKEKEKEEDETYSKYAREEKMKDLEEKKKQREMFEERENTGLCNHFYV